MKTTQVSLSQDLFEKVATARYEWMACLDAITDWVFVKGPDLRIVKLNRAAASFFSRRPQELIGRRGQDLFGCDSLPADDQVVQQTFQSGQPQNAEVSNMPVPGEYQVSTYPLRNDSGEVVAVVEFVRDVTEQKAMQRRLLNSARLAAVGELATGVAHHFGNILMGVAGSIEAMLLMAEKEGFSSRVVQRLQLMHRELMRGDRIVKRLLSFAQETTPLLRPVSASEVVEAVVRLCQSEALSHGVTVEWDPPAEAFLVRADPSQLREVLLNLVVNALQATSKDGWVRLMACPDVHTVEDLDAVCPSRPSRGGHHTTVGEKCARPCIAFMIADTGCGIAADDMPRLFTPFFSRQNGNRQGTGLGLCASLGMVRAMGGYILVESRVGKGSTFVVVMPAASKQGKEAQANDEAPRVDCG